LKVINLSSWAGRHFSLAPGDLIDMPEAVALKRLAAGLVREPTSEELAELEVKPYPGMNTILDAAPRPTLGLPSKSKRR
jgi:hypothetical protein